MSDFNIQALCVVKPDGELVIILEREISWHVRQCCNAASEQEVRRACNPGGTTEGAAMVSGWCS